MSEFNPSPVDTDIANAVDHLAAVLWKHGYKLRAIQVDPSTNVRCVHTRAGDVQILPPSPPKPKDYPALARGPYPPDFGRADADRLSLDDLPTDE